MTVVETQHHLIVEAERSYRALLAVPSLPRMLFAMALARVAASMTNVALVLFTLAEYGSPQLAGLVTLAVAGPAVITGPIAGALLDRYGRSRLVMLDYLLGSAALALIGGLALADRLPAWLLLAIAALSALTTPLSTTGLRSLLPLVVPERLWERANAIDANAFVVALLIGPPAAGVLVQVSGGPVAIIAIGSVLAVAAVVIARMPEPAIARVTTGSLLADAWAGLRYTWANPTLRGLGFAMTSFYFALGVLTIVLPVLLLDRIGVGPVVVGAAWAVMAAGGGVAAFAFGHRDSRGRETRWLIGGLLTTAVGTALLLTGQSVWIVLLAMAVCGLANGPIDIAMFTLRQRRTDPAWMGRAFATSVALNSVGYPIGAAISGSLVNASLEGAIAVAVVASLLAAVLAWRLIPRGPG